MCVAVCAGCIRLHVIMSSSHGPSITHQDSFGGESDSLEYYIKFPAGNSDTMNGGGGGGGAQVYQSGQGGGQGQGQLQQQQQHLAGPPPPAGAESDYVFVVNGETSNIPIVLLLGWAGCQDKYLVKYSQIYEERG